MRILKTRADAIGGRAVKTVGAQMIAVLVVATVIGIIQWLVLKQIPTLGKSGQAGIQLILLPLGFGLFGWDLPYVFTAPFIIGGLAALLYSVKKQLSSTDRAS